MENECLKMVTGFIEDIWNDKKLERIPDYLHTNFIDHAMPEGFRNASGLAAYLNELGRNITHLTTIENLTVEENFVIVKVKIKLSALSQPFDAGKAEEVIAGHRILAFCDQRIIGHWEFLTDAH